MTLLLARIRRKLAIQERGQTVVELALVMPLLALLVVGLFDFTMAVSRSAQLTSAVQEGAAYGRRSPSDTSGIRTHVKQEGPGLNLTDANIVVSCFTALTTTTKSCTSATFGDSVRVQATYHYAPITQRMVTFMGASTSIVQSATSEIY
jgi:Flp pilus assembly protein TadG